MSLWSVARSGAAQVRRKKPDVSIALVRFRRGLNLFAERRFPKNGRRELNSRTPWIPERGSEKFLKREFLAENGGKQPVSAAPSDARGEKEWQKTPGQKNGDIACHAAIFLPQIFLP